jgi:ABC-type antimicrobial peptide transport system permease subunit
MSKHSITVIVGLLALTWSVSAYSCTNLLCNYCDYYGYCTSCVANAYISGSNCYCYSGYHQSYDTCVSSGLATWAYVLISIANVIFWIAIIVCIVRCIKRRRQGAQGRYNMIVEPAPIYGAAIAQNFINRANPAIPTNIAEANRTIPTGVPANPYMHNNPYSPPHP